MGVGKGVRWDDMGLCDVSLCDVGMCGVVLREVCLMSGMRSGSVMWRCDVVECSVWEGGVWVSVCGGVCGGGWVGVFHFSYHFKQTRNLPLV